MTCPSYVLRMLFSSLVQRNAIYYYMYINVLLSAPLLVQSTFHHLLQEALVPVGSIDTPILSLTPVNGKRHRDVKQNGKD